VGASGVRRTLTLAVAAISALSVASPALAVGARHAAPNKRVRHGTSTNWAGYAVTGAGPYTSVSSTWSQPAVDCTTTPTGFSAFWVGLDGDTTNTVEQTGTEANCSGGTPTYAAWFEMFPKRPRNYPNSVLPGDTFTASVTYTGRGRFALTLSDKTQGWSQTVSQRNRKAKLGSAEMIAEAPSTRKGVLPLANFGTVGFDADGQRAASE
jgi:hypothetical protein